MLGILRQELGSLPLLVLRAGVHYEWLESLECSFVVRFVYWLKIAVLHWGIYPCCEDFRSPPCTPLVLSLCVGRPP
jgi:hypothetical protein